jgi:hypothetical protein
MSKPEIVGITVSLDISEKSYGNGSQSFMNVQGRYPNPATLEEVITDGLNMYFAAWESLLASRYATGEMAGPKFKKEIEDGKIRLAKVRSFLAKQREGPDGHGEGI